MMMRPGDILGRIFLYCHRNQSSEFIHGAHGGHGSSEFKRMLNGIIFLVARAQEIFGGNLF